MKLARLNAALTAIDKYPAYPDDFRAIYPNIMFGDNITAATVADFPRMALIQEISPPATTYADDLIELLPVKNGAVWQQVWQRTTPNGGSLPAIKIELKRMARAIADAKHVPLSTAELLTFIQLTALELDATPTAAEYPLIRAIAQGRGITFAQAVTAAQARRDAYMVRAAVVEQKYHDVSVRIDAAATAAAAKVIYDELEALV